MTSSLSQEQQDQLVELLERCVFACDREGRRSIVGRLPAVIRARIGRWTTSARIYIRDLAVHKQHEWALVVDDDYQTVLAAEHSA